MTSAGFYGKLPARGDFVHGGLPPTFVQCWDAWLQQVMPKSRDILGERWLPAWLVAPVWHFALPAGHCGPATMLGLWMPSVDRVGRHFPLTVAAAAGPCAPAELRGRAADWLARWEWAALAALEQDWPPDQLASRLGADPVDCDGTAGDARGRDIWTDEAGLWWTEGGPHVPATELRLPGLPEAATFAAMLDGTATRRNEEGPAA